MMAKAWDCDPFAEVNVEPYDAGLDYEDDEGDWQVLALDRFADRDIRWDGRGEAATARCW